MSPPSSTAWRGRPNELARTREKPHRRSSTSPMRLQVASDVVDSRPPPRAERGPFPVVLTNRRCRLRENRSKNWEGADADPALTESAPARMESTTTSTLFEIARFRGLNLEEADVKVLNWAGRETRLAVDST